MAKKSSIFLDFKESVFPKSDINSQGLSSRLLLPRNQPHITPDLQQRSVLTDVSPPPDALYATQKITTQRLGLPLISTLQSPFNGLNFSTEGGGQAFELRMLRSASQKNFHLPGLPVICFLVAASLVVSLDLAKIGNA